MRMGDRIAQQVHSRTDSADRSRLCTSNTPARGRTPVFLTGGTKHALLTVTWESAAMRVGDGDAQRLPCRTQHPAGRSRLCNSTTPARICTPLQDQPLWQILSMKQSFWFCPGACGDSFPLQLLARCLGPWRRQPRQYWQRPPARR